MRRTLPILISVLVMLALSVRAPAAPPATMDPPEAIDHAVGRMPTDVEMVVVIDGISVARNMPATAGLFGILNDLGRTEDAKPHWNALLALLGWNEGEALDRLIGSRVILALSDMNRGPEMPWVILTDISAVTEQQIKEKVQTAARRAVEGQPVYALERGDYELATIRGAGDDRVTLLLGPAKRASLFDTMIRAMGKARGAAGTLAGTPMVRELADHASPGVLVAMRINPENPGAPRAPWDDFLVCTGTPKGRMWECRVAIRDAEVREHVRRVQPSSDAPYRAMSKKAMLAVLETRLSEPGAEPTNLFERFLTFFTLPQGAGGMLTGRQAVAVWPRRDAKGIDAEGPPTLCCAMAMETSDVEKMAPVGDKHVGWLIEQVERAIGSAGLPVPYFAGVSCQAVRSIPLELPSDASLRRVFDGPAHVAWSYPVAQNTQPAGAPRPGWWQVCVAGSGQNNTPGCERGGGACADASRDMVDALLQPPDAGETARWVSVGMIRPAQWAPIVHMITDGLKDSFPQAAGLVSMLERVEHVQWRLTARDNDDVVGTVSIEMTPARPAR